MRQFLSCRSAWMLVAFCFLANPSPLISQEDKAHPTKADLAKFGEFPVRFNGRVTTYDTVAKNYVRHLSGGEVCYDKDGKEHPAVRWLLDVMADAETRDDWRIFRIENANLLEQLDLKAGEQGKADRNHFSLNELRPKSGWLQDKAEVVEQNITLPEAEDQAILDLYNRLTHCVMLEISFSPLPAVTRDNAEAIIDRITFVENQALPMFVYSAMEKEWSTFPLAHLRESIAGDDAKNQNPLYHQLRDLLKAHKAQERESFRKGLEQYAASLKMSGAQNSPFTMAPSKDWVEIGVPPMKELYFYSDADASGHKVVDMSLSGSRSSQFFINHFPTADISPVDLQNAWRIELGLVPVSEQDAKQTRKSIEVAGRKALLMDDAALDDIELPRLRRFLTVVLEVEGQTFVLAWSGEKDTLAANREKFEELLKSIKISSAQELAEWFPGKARDEPPYPDRLIAAIVPDGKKIWTLVTSGTDQAVMSHREAFLEFLKTLKLKQTNPGRTDLDWTLPDGWERIGEYGEATFVLGRGENALPMTVIPLGDVREDSVPTLVDYWAKKIGMDPLTEQDRKSAVKEITVSGQQAFLIELQKPKEKAAGDSEITWQAPEGWKELPPGPLMQGSFEIVKGGASAKVSLMALPANNLLVANINRWRGQLDLPAQTEKEILKSVKDQKVDGQPGKLVELHNADTKQRILAAIVTSGEKDWFFKMMGDADVVDKERKAFEEFLKSVKFLEKDRTKTEGPMP